MDGLKLSIWLVALRAAHGGHAGALRSDFPPLHRLSLCICHNTRRHDLVRVLPQAFPNPDEAARGPWVPVTLPENVG
jgi:hypothetical protein